MTRMRTARRAGRLSAVGLASLALTAALAVPAQADRGGAAHTGSQSGEGAATETQGLKAGSAATGEADTGDAATQAVTAHDDWAPTATGTVGMVDVVQDGTDVRVGPIAACHVDGEASGSTPGLTVGEDGELAAYGRGETSCERSEGRAQAEVSGNRFATSVLEQYGGPKIRVRSYSASCHTTDNGSASSMWLSGVTGFSVPEEIPPNHEVLIPGETENDPPMARIVLNEFTAPEPPDGSLAMSAMRIELFPEGGPVTGDIRVGSSRCAPYGD
ncbi:MULTISPECIES: hypothetical protein [Prauserella salsuginis group]|uniref:Uncharacterized protein n=2 Tax=Prauserella salsuginis group TaxID=2893672 RepID=A0A839XN30_9PSEU|nr:MULTISPECIES: hypothetical protein [Prauserella salsuginis group]MBB3661335.1 hypothetical protein [Prauserella sediminis]MCR3719257.1 hypothetical protein [Prauserella flava]MCR3735730.1 hypothetical protein [Prauserella salsuginis]